MLFASLQIHVSLLYRLFKSMFRWIVYRGNSFRRVWTWIYGFLELAGASGVATSCVNTTYTKDCTVLCSEAAVKKVVFLIPAGDRGTLLKMLRNVCDVL